MKKRAVALLLAVAICLSILPMTALARDTNYFLFLPEPFDYEELSFDDSCIREAQEACDTALSLLGNLALIGDLGKTYDRIIDLNLEVQTQMVMAMVLYYRDPERYGSLYSRMLDETDRHDRRILQTLQTIFSDGECGPTMRGYAGEAQVEAVMAEKAASDRALALNRQETALVMEYRRADAEHYTCIYDHRIWDMEGAAEAYSAGKISYEQYLDIVYGIYARRSERLGEIYLELVDVRREIALEAGYEDYSHYAYTETYSRDYSPEDVAAYASAVKQYIGPLYQQMEKTRSYGCFREGAAYTGYSEAGLLDAISPYLENISSEVAASFAYLRTCNLVDADASEKKLPVCFTASLPAYNAAYIFCSRSNGNDDLENLIHEFGHFNAMVYGAGTGSYDTMEVHSQGMEALCLSFAEALYGSEAQNQVGKALYDLLYLVLVGCVYDALQQYAYATPGLTVDDLNRKSAELAAEFGLPSFGPSGLDYSWLDVSHNFESPLYYISYSTSALIALELYQYSCSAGLETAADLYLQFVSLSSVFSDFRLITARSGLNDPFEADTVRSLAEAFPACLDKQALALPFGDIKNCWAKEDITLLYLMGIMNGVSENSFAPNVSLSRAMAVTVLYRLCGCPETDSAANIFSDVPEDSWYSDAVAWAVKRGVILGTSETTFSPDKQLSCQEFALMLFRLINGTGGAGTDDGGTGADAWAAGAVAWCFDNAIFESERGSVAPKAVLTRAELSAALINFLDAI